MEVGSPPPCWASLPADILIMVENCLASEGREADIAGLRATCSAWRHALTPAPTKLTPLGKPAHLAAFPHATALDYGTRGGGHSLHDDELEAACSQLGGRLQALDISGAFQLTTPGLRRALGCCGALRLLAADGSTVQDAAFAGLGAEGPADSSGSDGHRPGQLSAVHAVLADGSSSMAAEAPLQRLEVLSLRGCLFLRGGLLADLAAACPALTSLDLADCALALNLNPGVAALLPRLTSLRRLVLDGNGADDAALAHVAALPHLRELSLRGSAEVTDAGLHLLARQRGGTAPLPPSRTSSAASAGGDEAAGPGPDRDAGAGLAALDISGCTSLTDQCWLAITEMRGLARLRMEHMAHLLQFPAMPEALPAALWRLPRLRRLSLAGSCCHPSKLKLLAASCGGSVTHLDIGTGAAAGGCAMGGGCTACSPCCCHGVAGEQASVSAQAAGPAYRRLTSLHERDLCEAASSFRQLQRFSAAGSALPLRVCTAFLAAAPAGRLVSADLRGCCLDADPPAAATAHAQQPPWQQQLFFSSGTRRALDFHSYPAVTGNSASRLQQLHAEAHSWQRPATAERFAAALRRQAPSLRRLLLGGASGLTDRHLASLRSLQALQWLCLAGSRAALSPTLLAEAAAGCPRVTRLDISNTAADDRCLAAVAALPQLCQLAVSGCSLVGSPGVQALARGPAARTLRWLDLSATGVDDLAAAELADACRQLRGLQLTGCHKLSPAGAEQLGRLERLTSLSLSRCPQAVTDSSLQALARQLPLLTRLDVSEAQQLTAEGLAAVLPLLPCLAHLDLTCCWQLHDEQLLDMLRGAASSKSSSSSSKSSGTWVTAANVQLPKGGSSPTGSPFKRRAHATA